MTAGVTTLGQLADLVRGRVVGDAGLPISGIAPIQEARPGQITFITNPRYRGQISVTNASAVIVGDDRLPESTGGPQAFLHVDDPYFAMCQVVRHFHDRPYQATGISPQAAIGDEVSIGRDPSIYPFAVIDRKAVIGDRVAIYPGCFIGRGTVIGDDSIIYPNVTIREEVQIGRRVIIHSGSVIGSDGFGYAPHAGEHQKIPQVGIVVIEDDVELGANVTIDRAALGRTVIGRGTKVDNLVQIAHNVRVGERSIIVAQAGISGSTSIGRGVILAGQVGVVGHVSIGDGVRIGAQSGVSKDVPSGKDVSGSPAVPHRQWLATQATLAYLPEMRKRLHHLEEVLHALEQQVQQSRHRTAGTRSTRRGHARRA